MSKDSIYWLGALALIWIIAAVLINPVGNFPLNDDWSYGQSVRMLVEHGELRFTGWVSMPLIAMIFWGAAFCLPFGFSFTALRCSTLASGLIGVCAVYMLLRECNADHKTSFMGALIVAFNPLYFSLSYTFMTDVHFFAAGMLSLLFFFRGIRLNSSANIACGLIFACIATLIRQFGIVIPIAFAAGYMIKYGKSRKNFLVALLPVLVTVAVLLGYEHWMRANIGMPVAYLNKTARLLFVLKKTSLNYLLSHMYMNTSVASLYLGLFLILPLLFYFRIQNYGTKNRIVIFLPVMCFAIFFMGAFIGKQCMMPLAENIMYDSGLGPALLRDTYQLKLNNLGRAPDWFWITVSMLSVFGAILLFDYILKQFTVKYKSKGGISKLWREIALGSAVVVYFMPIAIAGFFDRYLIFLIPLLLMLLVCLNPVPDKPLKNMAMIFVFLSIIPFAVFSIAGTYDYLSWNRARWKAIDYLTKEKNISLSDIEGGFEFDGLVKYDPQRSDQEWWSDQYRYLVAFGPVPGYNEIKNITYEKWMPPRKGKIYVLQQL